MGATWPNQGIHFYLQMDKMKYNIVMRHSNKRKYQYSPLFTGVSEDGKKNNQEDVGKTGRVIDELSTGWIRLFIVSK